MENISLQKIPPCHIEVSMDMSYDSNDKTKDEISTITSRRDFLKISMITLSPSSLLLLSGSESTNAQLHSEFSELASKIPGAEKPDIWYPSYFQGDWTLYRALYYVEQVQPALKYENHTILSTSGIDNLRQQLGQRYEYKVRFIRFRDHIIEDRLSSIRSELGIAATNKRVEST